ncbi:MAG: hypothetical protein ACKV19_25995, partial [Verrucomicrobiales bacterium]
MILSASHPLLSAALSLILGVGAAVAAEVSATDPATTPAKPGWRERVAAAPKKLAFWEKDKKNPPTTPESRAGTPSEVKTRPGTPRPSGHPATPPPATKPAAAKRGAPSTAKPTNATPPPPETPKKSFFSKLPALPFRGKSEPATPQPDTTPTAPPAAEKPIANKASLPQSQTGVAGALAPAKEEKKTGFLGLGRLRSDPAQKETDESDTVPAARTAARPTKSASPPAEPTQPTKEKPSFWSRVTAVVTPSSKPAAGLLPKPQTKPIPKGLAA